MLTRMKAKAMVTAGIAIAAILTSTGMVHADIWAPNAQAAAKISKEGNILLEKNIRTVTHPATGRYCLRVEGNINVRNSVAHATSTSEYGNAHVSTEPHDQCGNAENTLYVTTTYEYNNEWGDYGFMVSIP
jgi:hypothetical protein